MCYDECNCCEKSKVASEDYEAKTQKLMPEALLLAKRLSREMGLKPNTAIHTAANHFEIDVWPLEREVLRLGLL